jgi:hypothetical protein
LTNRWGPPFERGPNQGNPPGVSRLTGG